tara:strand:+ start:276 stop:629 length:354 start_codon:yes stop_codon:yes gene_type:complete
MSGIIGTSHSKSSVIGRTTDTAKAWVNFEGEGATSIRDSFNVSTVTDAAGSGAYTLNYITPMANTNYVVVCTCSQPNSIGLETSTYSTTATGLVSRNTTSDGLRTDASYVTCVIYGD